MRIGLVCLHTSPLDEPGAGDAGGMNVFVRGLGNALAADHEVEMLTRARTPEEVGRVVRLPGGALVRFLEADSDRPVRKEELMATIPAFQRSLAELPRFDVLHAHYWLSAMATALVASDTNTRFAVTLHTNALVKNAHLAPGDRAESSEREAGERAVLAAADVVLCVTGAEQAALIAGYGANPEHTVVVPPGVDTELFNPSADEVVATPQANTSHGRGRSRGELHNLPRAARFVVVGRVQPLKGQELAIRVTALVPGSRLHVIGSASGESGTSYLAQLRDLSAHLGLTDRVDFTGTLPRERIAAELAAADIALVPSFSESFGLVALEAAACGTPVIAQGVEGLRESVIDGETGILVAGREPARWAIAAYRLLNRTPKQREAGAHASLAYAARHNWASTARATLAAYGNPRSDEPAMEATEVGAVAAVAAFDKVAAVASTQRK